MTQSSLERLRRLALEGEEECRRLENALRHLEKREEGAGIQERLWAELGELRCRLFRVKRYLEQHNASGRGTGVHLPEARGTGNQLISTSRGYCASQERRG